MVLLCLVWFLLLWFRVFCNVTQDMKCSWCRIVDHQVQEVRAEGGVAILGAAEHNIILNLLACPPIK